MLFNRTPPKMFPFPLGLSALSGQRSPIIGPSSMQEFFDAGNLPPRPPRDPADPNRLRERLMRRFKGMDPFGGFPPRRPRPLLKGPAVS